MNLFKHAGIATLCLIIFGCAHVEKTPDSKIGPRTLETDTYTLNLNLLNLMDPKPLQVQRFKPDDVPGGEGVRILSTGRVFPFTYEIISVATQPKPGYLEKYSAALEGDDNIILKHISIDEKLGRYLHYFHLYSENGQPHHVSSNYLFAKNGVFYHVSAINYGAIVLGKTAWDYTRPDDNAESEVRMVLTYMEFK
jgi:hypothetical protein